MKSAITVHIANPYKNEYWHDVVKRSYTYNASSDSVSMKEDVLWRFKDLDEALRKAKELRRSLPPEESLY